MKKITALVRTLAVLTVCALAPSQAFAGFIDFEGLADGTVITNQFADVVFSANAGQENLITTQPGIGFGANFICTGAAGTINCTQETILTFSSGVNDLSFWQVGDNDVGVVGQVDVFEGGILSATVDIMGFDTFNTPDFVDLTAFMNVTSIRIHSITDGGGLGWDDFNFTAGAVNVPEPGMLALFALGLLGIGFARRKTA